MGRVGGGLIKRDFNADPVGGELPVSSRSVYPRREWRELIELQREASTSRLAVHRFHNVPILDQATLPYCWVFAPTAGVMNLLGSQGIDPVPRLSATAPGAQFKRYRKTGGYVLEGVRAIKEYGLPSVDVWAQGRLSRHLATRGDVKRSASDNKLVEFSELPNGDFNALVSTLIDERNPRPVALAIPWWRHAVLAVSVTYRGNEYGIEYVNSHGVQHGKRGVGVLWGAKAQASEQIVIEQVGARSE